MKNSTNYKMFNYLITIINFLKKVLLLQLPTKDNYDLPSYITYEVAIFLSLFHPLNFIKLSCLLLGFFYILFTKPLKALALILCLVFVYYKKTQEVKMPFGFKPILMTPGLLFLFVLLPATTLLDFSLQSPKHAATTILAGLTCYGALKAAGVDMFSLPYTGFSAAYNIFKKPFTWASSGFSYFFGVSSGIKKNQDQDILKKTEEKENLAITDNTAQDTVIENSTEVTDLQNTTLTTPIDENIDNLTALVTEGEVLPELEILTNEEGNTDIATTNIEKEKSRDHHILEKSVENNKDIETEQLSNQDKMLTTMASVSSASVGLGISVATLGTLFGASPLSSIDAGLLTSTATMTTGMIYNAMNKLTEETEEVDKLIKEAKTAEDAEDIKRIIDLIDKEKKTELSGEVKIEEDAEDIKRIISIIDEEKKAEISKEESFDSQLLNFVPDDTDDSLIENPIVDIDLAAEEEYLSRFIPDNTEDDEEEEVFRSTLDIDSLSKNELLMWLGAKDLRILEYADFYTLPKDVLRAIADGRTFEYIANFRLEEAEKIITFNKEAINIIRESYPEFDFKNTSMTEVLEIATTFAREAIKEKDLLDSEQLTSYHFFLGEVDKRQFFLQRHIDDFHDEEERKEAVIQRDYLRQHYLPDSTDDEEELFRAPLDIDRLKQEDLLMWIGAKDERFLKRANVYFFSKEELANIAKYRTFEYISDAQLEKAKKTIEMDRFTIKVITVNSGYDFDFTNYTMAELEEKALKYALNDPYFKIEFRYMHLDYVADYRLYQAHRLKCGFDEFKNPYPEHENKDIIKPYSWFGW